MRASAATRLACLAPATGAGLALAATPEAVPGKGPRRPRLVILYATCSLNRDYLQPYDPAVGFTPNLAGFGAGAVVFDRHDTEAGQSRIAFASLFSGDHAMDHVY